MWRLVHYNIIDTFNRCSPVGFRVRRSSVIPPPRPKVFSCKLGAFIWERAASSVFEQRIAFRDTTPSSAYLPSLRGLLTDTWKATFLHMIVLTLAAQPILPPCKVGFICRKLTGGYNELGEVVYLFLNQRARLRTRWISSNAVRAQPPQWNRQVEQKSPLSCGAIFHEHRTRGYRTWKQRPNQTAVQQWSGFPE